MQNLLISIDLHIKLCACVHAHLSFFLISYEYEPVSVSEACIFMGRPTSELGATLLTKSTTQFAHRCKNIQWFDKGHVADMPTSDREETLPTSPPIHHIFF